MMGKTVEEADDDEDQRIGNHNGLIADFVNDPAHNRSGKEAGNSGHGKQKADRSGVCAVEQNQNIGAEGKEHLLPGTVEHLQHVILGVFFVEIKTAFGFIGLTPADDSERADHTHSCQNGGQTKHQLVGLAFCEQRKSQYNDEVSYQRTHLTDGSLDTLGSAAPARPCILQGQGAFHTQLDMLTKRIDADGQRSQKLGGRQQGMHAHAAQHDHGTGFEQTFR